MIKSTQLYLRRGIRFNAYTSARTVSVCHKYDICFLASSSMHLQKSTFRPVLFHKVINKQTTQQTGRRLDSAPSPNFVAMATRVGSPGRPKHLRSISHTSRLIGDFLSSFIFKAHEMSKSKAGTTRQETALTVALKSQNLPKFRCHGNKSRPITFCIVPLNRSSPKTP